MPFPPTTSQRGCGTPASASASRWRSLFVARIAVAGFRGCARPSFSAMRAATATGVSVPAAITPSSGRAAASRSIADSSSIETMQRRSANANPGAAGSRSQTAVQIACARAVSSRPSCAGPAPSTSKVRPLSGGSAATRPIVAVACDDGAGEESEVADSDAAPEGRAPRGFIAARGLPSAPGYGVSIVALRELVYTAVLSVAVAVAVVTSAASYAATSPTPAATGLATGKALYRQFCGQCHALSEALSAGFGNNSEGDRVGTAGPASTCCGSRIDTASPPSPSRPAVTSWWRRRSRWRS